MPSFGIASLASVPDLVGAHLLEGKAPGRVPLPPAPPGLFPGDLPLLQCAKIGLPATERETRQLGDLVASRTPYLIWVPLGSRICLTMPSLLTLSSFLSSLSSLLWSSSLPGPMSVQADAGQVPSSMLLPSSSCPLGPLRPSKWVVGVRNARGWW